MTETRLRQMLRSRRRTLSSLALALGIPLSRLSMIASGHRPATVEVASRIAEEMGVTIDDIFLPDSFTVREVNEETAS